MRGRTRQVWLAGVVASVALALPAGAGAAAIIYTASGVNAAAIQATVDLFRTDLGTNNGAGGTFPSGRREINWDGVPDGFSAPNLFPANFFNVNSPRGVVFSTAGTGFQVSSNTASGVPVRFGNIDPSYTNTFGTFSAERLFTALGSNVTDVNFFIPGTTQVASTPAFGVVFTDVDGATASVQYFDTANSSLGTFAAGPVIGAQATLEFVGVRFNAGERVGRVRITSGTTPLGTGVLDNPPGTDLVVMDDFIYGEPQSIATAVALRSASAVRTGRGVTIRWRTGSETSTLGFQIYRETGGRRVRVSGAPILAVFGGTATGHAYSFVDRKAPRTGALRYRIRAVGLDGSASWLGSVSVR